MTARAPRQVVVLSSIDWDTAWQRHQIFATAFAADGDEVFFVENTGFRNPGWRDLPRLGRRARNLADPGAVSGTNTIPPRVKVFTPRVLPPTWPLFRRLNSAVFLPVLMRELREAGLRDGASCLAYSPTATTVELARRLRPSVVVYDCASNFRAHPSAPPDIARLERELLELSDQVVCDSPFLHEQKKAEHPFVERIHQGVPDEFFALPPARGEWTRFCYYGTWSRDLDARLPNALAETGFEVAVRGFSKGDAPQLLPAVERYAPVPRESLAESLAPYDAFLMPYRLNPFLMGVIPAKIYECLATGRPLIATSLPALRELSNLIYLADTPEQWVQIARGLPKTESEERRRARIEHAREHSCAAEFRRLKSCLEAARKRRAQAASGPDYDVLFLSERSWLSFPASRRAEVAAWAAAGRRVFILELGGHGFLRRLSRGLFGSSAGERETLPHGVELVSALFLPATWRLGREANAALLAPRIADLLRDRGLGASVLAVELGSSSHTALLLAELRPFLHARAGEGEPAGPSSLAEPAKAARARGRALPHEAAALPAFVRGLGWIGLLYGSAKIATLVTQIGAGRWLGPEEYGRANLAIAGASYLLILPMMGFPAAMGKFLAPETDENKRARFISSALLAFAAWTLLVLPPLAVAHHALERALGLPPSLFGPTLGLAVLNAVYVVVASPLLGLKRFAHRGLVETVYGFSAPAMFLAAVCVFGADHRAMLASLVSSYAFGSIYALWCLRRYLRPAFEAEAIRAVWRYAAVATLNLLAAACVLAPARFALHARGGAEAVGVFSAYFTTTVQLSLALLYMLQSVIVPLASDARGQREAWRLARRWGAPAALASWAVFLGALCAALVVFGKSYTFEWSWALAFSSAAALALIHGAVSALYSARDFAGLRISVAGGLLTGAANAALTARFVPGYGVGGAGLALACSFALGLAFFLAAARFESRES